MAALFSWFMPHSPAGTVVRARNAVGCSGVKPERECAPAGPMSVSRARPVTMLCVSAIGKVRGDNQRATPAIDPACAPGRVGGQNGRGFLIDRFNLSDPARFLRNMDAEQANANHRAGSLAARPVTDALPAGLALRPEE
jgi:hypothetical protein